MHQTSRIRVLSDRIPRALVFVYFCRGLLENMKRRPTCQVYNEIITCRTIFLDLEESRSHGNEREANRARGLGARPALVQMATGIYPLGTIIPYPCPLRKNTPVKKPIPADGYKLTPTPVPEWVTGYPWVARARETAGFSSMVHTAALCWLYRVHTASGVHN